LRDVVGGVQQGEARIVAEHVRAEAEADVPAAPRYEGPDGGDVWGCFVHCVVEICVKWVSC
jgi:hypothetical protein